MITAIEIENFKAFGKRQRIELAPITLLYGPNSAGKSSLLHALHYLTDLFDGKDINAHRTSAGGEHVDLGGFASFVHGRNLNSIASFAVEVRTQNLGTTDLRRYSGAPEGIAWLAERLRVMTQSIRMEISIRCASDSIAPFISRLSVACNGQRMLTLESIQNNYVLSEFNYDHPLFAFELEQTSSTPMPDGSSAWHRRHTLDIGAEFMPLIRFNTAFAKLSPVGIEDDDILEEDELNPDNDESTTAFKNKYTNWMHYWLEKTTGLPIAEVTPETFGLSGFGNNERLLPFPGDDYVSVRLTRNVCRPVAELSDAMSDTFREVTRVLGPVFVELLVDTSSIVNQSQKSSRHIGPIRAKPERDPVVKGNLNEVFWYDGWFCWEALLNGEYNDRDINDWLMDTEGFNSGIGVKVEPICELSQESPLFARLLAGRLLDDDEDIKVQLTRLPVRRRLTFVAGGNDSVSRSPHDVGEGIHQLLPVIGGISWPGMLCIEQPELHIHPRMQVVLGDLFLLRVNYGSGLIVETHSEHILLRLLRRIRETTDGGADPSRSLSPNDLSVVYLDPGPDGTLVTRLRVDASGEFLDPWPQGFFEERGEELFG